MMKPREWTASLRTYCGELVVELPLAVVKKFQLKPGMLINLEVADGKLIATNARPNRNQFKLRA